MAKATPTKQENISESVKTTKNAESASELKPAVKTKPAGESTKQAQPFHRNYNLRPRQ